MPEPKSPDSHMTQYSNDEIDLRELFKALWDGKLTIMVVTFVFSLSATCYGLLTPNVYQSQSSFLIDRNFFNLFNTTDKREPDVASELIISYAFKMQLMDYAHLDKASLSSVNISYDRRNDTFSITSMSPDPQNAFDSVETVTHVLNPVVKLQELKKAKLAVGALQAQLDTMGSITKEYLDEILAQQIFKKVMLESPDTEIVKVIHPASMPTSHVKPKRPLIFLLGTLLGGVLGVAVVLIRFSFRKE
ncbi:Wzz/FepE/Etk N-terminal domain-containing protein [Vibrio fluvialis]|uniref:Wzz/FepE/Etk N-terminal domain-containing protein n=1 Tax=Vibrio fluvialis TaxID=676 RepID=UPI003080E4A4